jgi:hypothetical protein
MMMRIGVVATLALLVSLPACNRGGGGGNDAPATPKEREEARADSVANEQKALRDSGVTVDTQVIDTGSATAQPAVEDD